MARDKPIDELRLEFAPTKASLVLREQKASAPPVEMKWSDLMTKAFASEDSRPVVEEWLRTQQNLVRVESSELPARLAAAFPSERKAEETFLAHMSRMSHQLEKLPVIADLRQRARSEQAPFQNVGAPIVIGVPDPKSQAWGTVYVKFNSPLSGRVVQILHPHADRSLIVNAKGGFPTAASV